jgi:5-methylcytosine-specific restriction endonuclease McrA
MQQGPHHHLYKTRAWKGLRAQRLAEDPLCTMCKAQGHLTAATVVDHVKPHKGDHALFFAYANTQSLCKPHHDRAKQREDRRGYGGAIGPDGWPIDARHPANRKAHA